MPAAPPDLRAVPPPPLAAPAPAGTPAPALEAPPDSGLAVETRALTKSYRNPWTLRTTRGVTDLTLGVRRGEVLGYLGPNGAGKTTTIKVLTGLHKATSGAAWLLGERVELPRARRRLGFLPEQPYFYDYLNGIEYLEFVGRLSGLGAHEATTRARHWMGRVGLGDRTGLMLRKYSKGMLQRIGLAATLLHDPELLILDEPMSGLDPFGRRDVRELILEQRERGLTVMFSSHILPDVEMICDRVAIVLDGRLQRVGTVGELVSEGQQRVEVRCTGNALVEMPPALAGVVERLDGGHESRFLVSDDARLGEVLTRLIDAGFTVRAVTPQRPTLEELFMATAEKVARERPGTERRTA